MKKGDASRQHLIECAARLFWQNGYSATGISEILQQTGLPKGSFYFYFKSKDELAMAVTACYQEILLDHFQDSAHGHTWEPFVEDIFAYLSAGIDAQPFSGCPYAVMGMETALSKPEISSVFMDELQKIEHIFYKVLLNSGLSDEHAEYLSERFLSVYQGELLLGRISKDSSHLWKAKKHMLEIYREYRLFHNI